MGVNDEYKPCSARKSLTMFHRDGTKERIQRCHEPTAEKHGSTVLPADCSVCPVRKEITAAALRSTEYKPPLVAELRDVRGAVKDVEPPESWAPCQDRNVVAIGGCCGSVVEIRVCDSIDCFRLGSEVSLSMCLACPDRRA